MECFKDCVGRNNTIGVFPQQQTKWVTRLLARLTTSKGRRKKPTHTAAHAYRSKSSIKQRTPSSRLTRRTRTRARVVVQPLSFAKCPRWAQCCQPLSTVPPFRANRLFDPPRGGRPSDCVVPGRHDNWRRAAGGAVNGTVSAGGRADGKGARWGGTFAKLISSESGAKIFRGGTETKYQGL